jgi:hypothetical protein
MMESPDKDKMQASDIEFTELARDGHRLMKAFLGISDHSERTRVINFAEQLAHKKRLKSN